MTDVLITHCDYCKFPLHESGKKKVITHIEVKVGYFSGVIVKGDLCFNCAEKLYTQILQAIGKFEAEYTLINYIEGGEL